jgi:site-specific DNA-methyltransferase (adenine-specific)
MIITVARTPFEVTVVENIVENQCGGLNLVGCGIPFVSELDKEESLQKNRHGDWDSEPPINNGIYSEYKARGSDRGNYSPKKRHASNFILGEGVLDSLFPYISYKGEKLYVSRVYRRIK